MMTLEQIQVLEQKFEADYQVAEAIRTEIIPNAVVWYRGGAEEDNDDDDDDDDDAEEQDTATTTSTAGKQEIEVTCSDEGWVWKDPCTVMYSQSHRVVLYE